MTCLTPDLFSNPPCEREVHTHFVLKHERDYMSHSSNHTPNQSVSPRKDQYTESEGRKSLAPGSETRRIHFKIIGWATLQKSETSSCPAADADSSIEHVPRRHLCQHTANNNSTNLVPRDEEKNMAEKRTSATCSAQLDRGPKKLTASCEHQDLGLSHGTEPKHASVVKFAAAAPAPSQVTRRLQPPLAGRPQL